MRIVFLLIFGLWGLSLQADDQVKVLAGYDPLVDIIADNYEAGAFLIYDCKEKHWTCVLRPYYDDCKLKQEYDQYSHNLHIRCAAFKEFPTKKSCFQKQLFLTGQDFGTRFCINNKWREKDIEF